MDTPQAASGFQGRRKDNVFFSNNLPESKNCSKGQQLLPLRDLGLTILKIDKERKEQAAVAGEQSVSGCAKTCVSSQRARGFIPGLFKVKSGGA